MKNWGIYLFTGLTALGQSVRLGQGAWTPLATIFSTSVIAINFTYLKRTSQRCSRVEFSKAWSGSEYAAPETE